MASIYRGFDAQVVNLPSRQHASAAPARSWGSTCGGLASQMEGMPVHQLLSAPRAETLGCTDGGFQTQVVNLPARQVSREPRTRNLGSADGGFETQVVNLPSRQLSRASRAASSDFTEDGFETRVVNLPARHASNEPMARSMVSTAADFDAQLVDLPTRHCSREACADSAGSTYDSFETHVLNLTARQHSSESQARSLGSADGAFQMKVVNLPAREHSSESLARSLSSADGWLPSQVVNLPARRHLSEPRSRSLHSADGGLQTKMVNLPVRQHSSARPVQRSLTPRHTAERASRRQRCRALQESLSQQEPFLRGQQLTPGSESSNFPKLSSKYHKGARQRNESQHTFSVGVFVRVRPASTREYGELECIQTDGSSISVQEPMGGKKQHFSFEGVIDSRSGLPDQAKVFQAVGSRVIQSLCEGFHTCVFALGQTGTGKTHTLIGNSDEPGLLPWTLRQLLYAGASGGCQKSSHVCTSPCRLSCMELHMDRLHDLLTADPSERQGLDIRCHPQTGVTVPGLTEVVVRSVHAGLRLVNTACRRRSITRTSMNAVSSRGHTIFQVSNEIGTRLCIVDLAGRENERTTLCRGRSLAELGYINKSLFHLTSVIQALARPSAGGLVPFRNSKLTLLLSESLQCARTFLLATVSPVASSFDETSATLRLAQSVRQITTRSRRESQREVPGPMDCDSATQVAGPIPFAPRLEEPLAQDESTPVEKPAAATGELRQARFRLEAWKRPCTRSSSLSLSPGSTATADSRSPTDAGDSDLSYYEVVEDSPRAD